MNESEIESIVVKIQADNANFSKQLQSVNQSLQQTAVAAQASTSKLDMMAKSVDKIGIASRTTFGLLAQGLGAVGISMGGMSFLKDTFRDFSNAEEISIKLTSALSANGREVQKTMADYQSFAKTMQDVTTHDDDAVLSMLQMAESMGVTGEKAKRAVQNAIGMEAAGKGTASGNIRMTAAFEQTGDAKILQRQFRTLGSIKDATAKAAEANKLLANSWQVAQAAAGSSAGRIKQMNNAIGNLKETFGAVVAEVVGPFVSGIKKVAEWLEQSDPLIKKVVVGLAMMAVAAGPIMLLGPSLLAMTPVLLGIGAAIFAANETLAYFGVSWQDVFDIASQVFLDLTGLIWNWRENVGAVIEWVQQNWMTIFANIGAVIVKFCESMLTNISTILQSSRELFAIWSGYIIGVIASLFGESMPEKVADGIAQIIKLFYDLKAKLATPLEAVTSTLSDWVLEAGGKVAGLSEETMKDLRTNLKSVNEIEAAKAQQDIKNQGEIIANRFREGVKAGAKTGGIIDAVAASKNVLDEAGLKNPLEGLSDLFTKGLNAPSLNFVSPLTEFYKKNFAKVKENVQPIADAAKAELFFGDNKVARQYSQEFNKAISNTVTALRAKKPGAGDAEKDPEDELVASSGRQEVILGQIRDALKGDPLFEVSLSTGAIA